MGGNWLHMKTKVLPLAIALLGFGTSAFAFGPYFNPYDGTATVKTGKKSGVLDSTALASTTDGTDAKVTVTGEGSRGVRVSAILDLDSKGKGTLTLVAKVLADPKLANKGTHIPSGKKVVVRFKAKGTYTVEGDTATFVFSGNAGKGGNNVTGTFTTDALGNLSLQFSSGFKQKISGVGRRLQFSFEGTSSTVPMP
jgi:hypothetical protein